MKRLAMLVVLVSFGLFALGCEDTKRNRRRTAIRRRNRRTRGEVDGREDGQGYDEARRRADAGPADEGREQDRRGPARREQDTR